MKKIWFIKNDNYFWNSKNNVAIYGPFNSQQNAIQDATFIMQEIRMVDIIKHITRNSYEKLLQYIDNENNDIQKEYEIEKKKLSCLYVTKVLHGLQSRLLPSSSWKDHTAWGRYKDIDFDYLYMKIYEKIIQ